MSSLSKTQVDQLGDRLRKGGVSDDDLRLLDAYRESFAEAYEEAVATIRSATGLEPAGRWKTNISIIEKLLRESTMRLSRMQDIAGCRLVVEDTLKQDWVVERLMRAFQPAKVDDRRKRPSHGYRAVHVKPTVQGKLVEIQVRTELQHLWAQQSELLADRVDSRIKYGGGNPGIQEILSRYSGYVADVEAVEGKSGVTELMHQSQLEDRKAQVRRSLDELTKIFQTLPRRAN